MQMLGLSLDQSSKYTTFRVNKLGSEIIIEVFSQMIETLHRLELLQAEIMVEIILVKSG